MTTFALSIANTNVWGPAVDTSLALAIVFGGGVQLLAGMWEFVRKNTFGATAWLGHLCHGIRRNVHLVHVMENNGVYDLTKGQFSPTADRGTTSHARGPGDRRAGARLRPRRHRRRGTRRARGRRADALAAIQAAYR